MTKALFKLLICTNLCKRRLFEVTVSVTLFRTVSTFPRTKSPDTKQERKEIFTFDCKESFRIGMHSHHGLFVALPV